MTAWRIFFLLVLFMMLSCAKRPEVIVRPKEITKGIYLTAESAFKIYSPAKFSKMNNLVCIKTEKRIEQTGPLPQDGEAGGRAVFKFHVSVTDTYTLFGMVFWPGEGASNSFYVKMDNSPYERFGNDGYNNMWEYIKGPSWALDTGSHLLTVRERESGCAFHALFLSPIPEYVNKALGFKNSVYLEDTSGFKDSIFMTAETKLLLYPPYSIEPADKAIFHLFYADTGKHGVLANKQELPFRIKDLKGRDLFFGRFNTPKSVYVCIKYPRQGRYTINVGSLDANWAWYYPRLIKLEKAVNRYKSKPTGYGEIDRWIATLELYYRNILQGFKRRHQQQRYQQSLDYVERQFDRAEKLMKAMKVNDFSAINEPGHFEYAYYSAVDSTLCPYVLYLPEPYFKDEKKFPLMLYLHGMNGTQWEIERNLEYHGKKMSMLKYPWIIPFARGNHGYRDTVVQDVMQLLRLVMDQHRIDTTRLVLSGFSMGGIGTWHLATQYPDLFDIIVPQAGAFPWVFNEKKKMRQPRLLPKNFRSRVIIIHSSEDKGITIDYALHAMRVLEKQKIPCELIRHDSGHEVPAMVYDIYNGLFRN